MRALHTLIERVAGASGRLREIAETRSRVFSRPGSEMRDVGADAVADLAEAFLALLTALSSQQGADDGAGEE